MGDICQRNEAFYLASVAAKPLSLAEDTVKKPGCGLYLGIGYISDLHLDRLIARNHLNPNNLDEIADFIRGVIPFMIEEYWNCDFIARETQGYISALIVCGDVSDDFNLTCLFYRELAFYLADSSTKIFAVLGNHELMGLKGFTYDEIVLKYQTAFQTINDSIKENHYLHRSQTLFLLENAIYTYPFCGFSKNRYERFYSESDLALLSDQELSSILNRSRMVLFGALGFSGLSERYDSESFYGGAIDVIEDRILSSITSNIHERLRRVASSARVVFVTHMPPECWRSNPQYVTKWIYINGHTHINHVTVDETMAEFADAQMGYEYDQPKIKALRIPQFVDIFSDMPDGIHPISPEQMKLFYEGYCERIGQRSDAWIKRVNELFVLKKQKYKVFVSETNAGLRLMQGCKFKKTSVSSLNDFWNHFDYLAGMLDSAMFDYRAMLRQLSKEVRSLGGIGRIHGCIVDVNYRDHLFINPVNGYIGAYHADNIVEKYFFKNPISMITLMLPGDDQIEGYALAKRILPANSLIMSTGTELSSEIFEVEDTWHYSMNRVAKDLERLETMGVLRYWNDDIYRAVIEAPSEKERLRSALQLVFELPIFEDC